MATSGDGWARHRLVRFKATGEGHDFVATVGFDADGLVDDYPGIAARLPDIS